MMIREAHVTPSAAHPRAAAITDRTGYFRHLLVPVDGSARAEQVLPLAMTIARPCASDIDLVWVCPAPQPDPDAGRRSVRMGCLEALTEEVADRLGAPVHRTVLSGRPAEAIVRHAFEDDVDLIVMASRGHGGLWRMGIGSTTNDVVRDAHVPVLVMRVPDDAEPDLDTRHAIDEIVIALDGSDAAESTIGPALDLARQVRAGITLLRVVESPGPLTGPLFASAVQLDTEAARRAHAARAYVDRVAARLRAGGIAVKTAVREAPDAATGILHFAREASADIVAIATHGAGRAPRLFRGSTASRLLNECDVPLLVVNRSAARHRALHG